MTVLLILLTLILFLAADRVVESRRRQTQPVPGGQVARPRLAADAGFRLPADVRLAWNHTWVRFDPASGVSTLGVDDFLGRLVGSPSAVALPRPGDILHGDVRPVRLGTGEKTISLALPLQGEVLETNGSVQEDPALIRRDPYGEGWLIRMRGRWEDGRAVVHGRAAAAWLREETDRIIGLLAGTEPAPALVAIQDGGLPSEGILRDFGPEIWKSFEETLAARPRARAGEGTEGRS
ncbi:MAG: glycine cleavage system protein H [Bacteroidota bacterium]